MPFVTWSESPGSPHFSDESVAFSLAMQLGHYNTQSPRGLPPALLSNCTQASLNIAESRDKISSHFQNTSKLCDEVTFREITLVFQAPAIQL